LCAACNMSKANLLQGMAHPSRLSILEALRNGPRVVSDLVGVSGLKQSGVSNHLAHLHELGLVKRERHGQFVYYELSDPRVEMLLTVAGDLAAVTAPHSEDSASHKLIPRRPR